jgi:Mn2+/Fe2+ NRAMP family transporter
VLAVLVAASIVGGIGTPMGIVVLVLLARDRAVMGEQVVSRALALAGWVVASVVGALGLLFVIGAAAGQW